MRGPTLVNIPLAFLVPSSSGHATLAMPIMAPLGDFAGVSRAMVVTAYQSASGWMNLFTPTSAIVMGGLALSKVRYDRYLKFIAPLLGILLILTCLFMLLGVAVPALGGPVKWMHTTRTWILLAVAAWRRPCWPAPVIRPSRCPGPPTTSSSSRESTPPRPPASAPRCEPS